ncbi:ORF6N domain-containing protein [Amedibacillus sp. YH-ame6]
MNEIITKDKEFKDLVHVIRGQQVILDSDLALLYGTEVKNLNRQVKRNSGKFPEDFMFQLMREEIDYLMKCQNGTTPNNFMTGNEGGRRTMPYVFTEQGIYMVATILKNDIATQQSIYIMRSFKEMRHYIAENKMLLSSNELSNINQRLDKHEADIVKIMDNFINDTTVKEITFLEGQRFEANEAYISIYRQAKYTIYVIDNFVDINTLSLLKHKQNNVVVTLFTANKSVPKLQRLEVHNFDREYPNLYVKRIRDFHDRYIVLDYGTSDEIMFHCGHSSKDTGNKVSTIHKMLDTEVMHPVIDKILENSDSLFR